MDEHDNTSEARDELLGANGLYGFAVRPGEGLSTLVMSGQIDQDSMAELHGHALRLAGAGTPVAIDWSQAQNVCTGALQVLLALSAALAENGHALTVADDNPGIRTVLLTAGLSASFPENGIAR